jgi:hypothetical protein
VAVVVLVEKDEVDKVMVMVIVLSRNVTIVVATSIRRIIVGISMRDLLLPTKFLMTLLLLLCIRHLPIVLRRLVLVLMMTSLLRLNQLIQQLSSLSPKLSTSTATMASAGNSAYVVANPSSTAWIIDSRASAHMTSTSSLLSDFRPSNSDIVLADGSFRPGLGTSDSRPNPSMPLTSGLFVPQFPFFSFFFISKKSFIKKSVRRP